MEAHLIQRSAEWLKWRKSKIGASEVGILMSVNPWKTILDLYNEKITPYEDLKPQEENYAMRRGNELEPLALAKFEQETGLLMMPTVKVHPTIPYLSASYDGMDLDCSSIVEIKCVGQTDHAIALKGQVPEKYYPQVQMQIEISGLDESYYMSYVSDTDYTIFKVKRDNEYIANMLERAADFWKRIQDRNPPEPTDRDFENIETMEWEILSHQYTVYDVQKKDLKDQLDRLESIQQGIKDKLLQISNYKPAIGSGIKLSKFVRRGHIDYPTIPELEGVDLEKHRKPSTEYWKIDLNKEEFKE